MFLPLGVSLNYVLLDASLALIAFSVGFVGAFWYCRHTAASAVDGDQNDQAGQDSEAAAYQAERANMAASQLRDLARNVASDVGAHNELVSGISSKLGALDQNAPNSGAAVTAAIDEILVANQKLQTRLEDAEKKIQSQAAELKTQQSEARTDSLTKLANRRAFDDSLEKCVNQFRKEKRPVSLLLFDVDHFKKFNDTHGHQAGDEVLRRVSKALSQTAKSTDLSCRYGGEEFALVMPNTPIAQARVAAERVRKVIEGTEIAFEGKMLRVTASIGVAEIGTGDNSADIIRRSDEGVYAAKAAGRNCGYWHDGIQCLPMDNPGKSLEQPAAATKNSNGTTPKITTSHQDLPDQAVFSAELQRRISESHRFGVSLTLMYLRVSEFNMLETEYGTAVGNLLLDSVSQFVRSTLREMDLLGRLDAGEFVVMLPGSSVKEATLVGSRVQTAISNCVIPLGGKRIKLEVQHGITGVEPSDDSQIMINRARRLFRQAEEPVSVA